MQRVASITEPARLVRLTPLPLALRDESIRIIGESGLVAHDARVSLALLANDETLPPPDDEELKAALEAEDLAASALDAHREVSHSLQDLKVLARPGNVEHPPGSSPDEARNALIAFKRQEMEKRLTRDRELVLKLRACREHRSNLQELARRASNARNPRAHQLRKAVDVRLDEGATGTLRLEYFVPGARWAPTYSLRLDGAMSEGALELRAQVAQRSGEDWRDAKVRLSTAEPLQWAELPELTPIRIGRRQRPPATVGWRPPPAGTDALFRDFDAAAAASPSPKAPKPAASPKAAKPRRAESTATGAAFGGVPMPPPQMAIPAAPPPPPGAPARSAAPQRARSSKKKEARKGNLQAKLMRAGGGGEGSRGDDGYGGVEEEAPMLEAAAPSGPEQIGRELLSFRGLRMGGADDSYRGKLRPASAEKLYREGLPDAPGDVGGSLRGAVRLASLIGRVPEQCTLPETVRGYDYAYDTDHRVDVPSSEAWVTVPVRRMQLEGKTRFVVVPREVSDVFREFEASNPLQAPLLDGPIDVYVDDAFLLATRVPQVDPSARLTLGLGVDSRISVARNARFEEHTAGLMRGSLDLEHRLEIEVQSQLDTPARVEVRERIPHVSRASKDDIEVQESEVSPPWADWEPKGEDLHGGRRWSITVEPRAKRTLRATYTIRIASKEQLVGGNRREQ